MISSGDVSDDFGTVTVRASFSVCSWTIIVSLSSIFSSSGSGYFSPRSVSCVTGVSR